MMRKHSPVGQPILREVHGPTMIPARGCLAARHALPLEPFPSPSRNQQPLLSADAMDPFVIHTLSLAPQHRDPQMPEPLAFPCDLPHLLSHLRVRRPMRLISTHRPAHPNQPASPSLAQLVLPHGIAHRFPALRVGTHFRRAKVPASVQTITMHAPAARNRSRSDGAKAPRISAARG